MTAAKKVTAQSALDGFNVSVNGPVRVVVVQPDGKVLLGGDFTTISIGLGSAVARDRIVRLNVDGSLDTAFNAAANATVRAIAVQPDGNVLIGGDFTIVDGRQPRNRIARLNGATGAVDNSFDPNASDTVNTIAVLGTARIYVGGAFTRIGGLSRLRIGRLSIAGAVDSSFDPRADGAVNTIVLEAFNKILVGGGFSNIGTQARSRIARLDDTGQADSFNPGANGSVLSIAIQADHTILAGGSFTGIGHRARNHIARLDDVNGIADASFNPNADDTVFSIAIQSEGKIVVGGAFSNIGGQPRNNIGRLDTFTGLADSFDPNANNIVLAVAAQQDNKIVAGGLFTTLMPDSTPFALTRNRIARLETDGRVDQTLSIGNIGSGLILATAVQTDGKILLGGLFDNVFGAPRHNLARLNTDGTLDELFDPSPNNLVRCITVQPDGNILIGGDFTMLSPFSGPVLRNRIARVEPVNGTVDSIFNPNSNGPVSAIVVQRDGMILVGGDGGGFTNIGGASRVDLARLDRTDGHADSTFNPHPLGGEIVCILQQQDQKILVGGSFTSIGGQPRRKLARLNLNGSVDNQFHPDPTGSAVNGDVDAIALQGDQKILAGGGFTTIGGASHTNMARLDPVTGAADNSFNPNPDNAVTSVVVQADGHIVAGGFFGKIGTFPRNRIGRVEPTSGLADLQFNPDATLSNNGFASVQTLALQADGKILVGGQFDGIGLAVRFNFARLTNDTAAFQNLAVTQTDITWNRAGSSPQFTHATFEFSTDNVNFSFLGDATASGASWVLDGLNLPIGENFVIRARGFYGCSSGSALGFRRNRALSAVPVIQSITANPPNLWPPDHKLVPVALLVEVTDDTDPNPKCKIASVTFVDPTGEDDEEDRRTPAFQITGDLTVNLRAGPKGRVYTITVRCKNASGHATSASIDVNVTHAGHDDDAE